MAAASRLGIVVDVSQNGARLTSIPMPVTDTWSYDAVPPGTYTFTVRATNAAGTSGSSNSVTLTFPLTSCSSPGTPVSFSFNATARVAAAYWLAPRRRAPLRRATRSRPGCAIPTTARPRSGLFPVTATTISSPVGPGRYEVRVRSENICGNSGFTGWQAVTVQ